MHRARRGACDRRRRSASAISRARSAAPPPNPHRRSWISPPRDSTSTTCSARWSAVSCSKRSSARGGADERRPPARRDAAEPPLPPAETRARCGRSGALVGEDRERGATRTAQIRRKRRPRDDNCRPSDRARRRAWPRTDVRFADEGRAAMARSSLQLSTPPCKTLTRLSDSPHALRTAAERLARLHARRADDRRGHRRRPRRHRHRRLSETRRHRPTRPRPPRWSSRSVWRRRPSTPRRGPTPTSRALCVTSVDLRRTSIRKPRGRDAPSVTSKPHGGSHAPRARDPCNAGRIGSSSPSTSKGAVMYGYYHDRRAREQREQSLRRTAPPPPRPSASVLRGSRWGRASPTASPPTGTSSPRSATKTWTRSRCVVFGQLVLERPRRLRTRGTERRRSPRHRGSPSAVYAWPIVPRLVSSCSPLGSPARSPPRRSSSRTTRRWPTFRSTRPIVGLLRHWGDPRYIPANVYELNIGQPNQLFYFLILAARVRPPHRRPRRSSSSRSPSSSCPRAGARLADYLGVTRWTAVLARAARARLDVLLGAPREPDRVRSLSDRAPLARPAMREADGARGRGSPAPGWCCCTSRTTLMALMAGGTIILFTLVRVARMAREHHSPPPRSLVLALAVGSRALDARHLATHAQSLPDFVWYGVRAQAHDGSRRPLRRLRVVGPRPHLRSSAPCRCSSLRSSAGERDAARSPVARAASTTTASSSSPASLMRSATSPRP